MSGVADFYSEPGLITAIPGPGLFAALPSRGPRFIAGTVVRDLACLQRAYLAPGVSVPADLCQVRADR